MKRNSYSFSIEFLLWYQWVFGFDKKSSQPPDIGVSKNKLGRHWVGPGIGLDFRMTKTLRLSAGYEYCANTVYRESTIGLHP
ncbi:MAG: hypothetical protein H6562_15905 [Lewinellaceae bacterium]|nr:hypothetical protein [Lewinellaceae bacterium]